MSSCATTNAPEQTAQEVVLAVWYAHRVEPPIVSEVWSVAGRQQEHRLDCLLRELRKFWLLLFWHESGGSPASSDK